MSANEVRDQAGIPFQVSGETGDQILRFQYIDEQDPHDGDDDEQWQGVAQDQPVPQCSKHSSPLGSQFIANPPHRQDPQGMVRITLDLFSQPADVDIDDLRLSHELSAPDPVQQLIDWNHPIWLHNQSVQKDKLSRCQLDRVPRDRYGMSDRVDHQISNLYWRWQSGQNHWALRTTKDRFNMCQEYVDVKGLSDV